MSSAGAWARLCQDIRRSVPAQTVNRSFILSLSPPVLPPPSHYWVTPHHTALLGPQTSPTPPLLCLDTARLPPSSFCTSPASDQHGEERFYWLIGIVSVLQQNENSQNYREFDWRSGPAMPSAQDARSFYWNQASQGYLQSKNLLLAFPS